MKIGIDARFYRRSTAGLGRYSQALISQLAKIDKINKYIIYLSPEDKKEYNVKAKNFKPKIVPITHYSLSEQTKFLNILNKDKNDLVHFLNFNHPIFYRGKFVTTVHDLTIMFFPTGRQQKSFIRRWAFKTVFSSSVKNAQRVIAISKNTKKDIEEIFKISSNKIDVIYEGIDKQYNRKMQNAECRMQNFKKKYNLNHPYLFFLSQWRPHKGLPELIKAFEILRERYKIPQLLVIGGKSNKNFPEIPIFIEKSGYKSKIIRPGFIPEEDLPLFYTCADVFIFPSKYEGFGLPPLEAMACGTPVISSNKSCMPEVLDDAAEYFDPSDPKKIAKKIKDILSNEQLMQEMSQKGLKQVKKYSWSKMAKETLKLYKKVLKRS